MSHVCWCCNYMLSVQALRSALPAVAVTSVIIKSLERLASDIMPVSQHFDPK